MGVLILGNDAQILCPNCDHKNSRSFTVLYNPARIAVGDCRVRSLKVVISGREQGDWPDLRVIVLPD